MTVPQSPYDYCILGAGIAGLSLADALQQRGYRVSVLEKKDIAAGASGTPGGLINPATGRRAKKVWHAEACYRAIRENLDKVAPFSAHNTFFTQNGVLRPALSDKMARRMHEQYNKNNWPQGWCSWQTEAEIKERHPGINCVNGGLWLPAGLTVDVSAYLKAYAAFLRSKGVNIEIRQPDFLRDGQIWRSKTGDQMPYARHLIHAFGLEAVDHPYWFHLPLSTIKGQIAVFEAQDIAFTHSISSLGYIARLKPGNRFVQGSTYEHDFSHLAPDADGAEYLLKRLEGTLPGLAERVTVVDQWAGVRVSTPDRKPVLGRHPEIPNLYIFGALGSKGLMYGKHLADHLAAHLDEGEALFPEISAARFENH